ncbi:ureidoglycolate hydrolase KNAG_0D03120 [Huiozyma naganishii CBS 8797]|uniref:Ureidoglycolate hydrolase n=1 Tax=Huiozyma naganishii (strain ATCC MYA-139 / BCRC 22969 / CBS 8797 / KCTC 17520 / NBRC 10181 / NCYC 3082 / Yp74L-3) TaxID=1071383 RepID=J7R5E4_HUIN7|nr:hypothetical protein KNAG_0D03120 [Kazachstania naganishii CBS 8797]CCK70060.1 hypothetical protein KNAG_0D03120 [Kazachstania naganishii CBS 8797]
MGYPIVCTGLTIHGFKPYGSIISPDEEVSKISGDGKNANQGTAIKILQVSDIQKIGTTGPSVPNWNMFRCFPQPHMQHVKTGEQFRHEVHVLEKHPQSSQTFVPMGRPSDEIAYLVVVALPQIRDGKDVGPDMGTLKAFLCKGNQAVSYGAGVWHAPMIVVGGPAFTDFAVLIYETLDASKPELDLVEQKYTAEDTIIVGTA